MQDDPRRNFGTTQPPAEIPTDSPANTPTDSAPPAPDPAMADSAEDARAAGPEASSEPIERPAYTMGTWSGIPSFECNWLQPDGSVCGAGFIDEEAFWGHHADHVIRAMTPEQRAEIVMAAANRGRIVGPDGRPLS